ncbi:MAG TPA: PQQ-dependent sugar dehydrogenase [Hyphomonadaceae bacterium]|nr:PQQ-dependent sugar dehydrogenase [Hyphomonadaceae bacterium]
MRKAVRASLFAALALSSAACGGGGSSPPASPPTSPPVGPLPPTGAPSFTSPAAVSVRENMIGVVYRPVATGASVTYGATIGGLDAARFAMNPVTREVRFVTQPDFEAPADANRNNVYDISFTASDGTNTVTQTVAITVTNVAAGFRVRRAITGLSAPIYATGLPDGSGRLVIVERAGRIRVVNPTTGAIDGTDFLNITSQVSTSGEKGLLSIAFSPNFLVDRTFYLHMNPSASSTTEIRKYTVSTTNYAQADAATGDVILSVPQPSATNHKGGTVVFDKSGRLLISLGDGGSDSNTAQDNNNLLGKILRIDPSSDAFPGDASRDYAIPPTNPFASGTGGRPEIYASGLRNPFRISVDPVTGDLFIADVGEGSLEEVNRLSASATGLANFGWNRREGSQAYNGGADSASYTLPVTEYGRSLGQSITGGVVYRGPIEDLQGQYIFADFISNRKWSAPIANLNVGTVLPAASLTDRGTAFTPNAGSANSLVAFGTDNDGNVYFVNISSGDVFVLEPNS